jgi:hypothetical protein
MRNYMKSSYSAPAYLSPPNLLSPLVEKRNKSDFRFWTRYSFQLLGFHLYLKLPVTSSFQYVPPCEITALPITLFRANFFLVSSDQKGTFARLLLQNNGPCGRTTTHPHQGFSWDPWSPSPPSFLISLIPDPRMSKGLCTQINAGESSNLDMFNAWIFFVS